GTLVKAVECRLDDPRVLPGLNLLLQAVARGAAGNIDQRGKPVEGSEDIVQHRARLDVPGPADDRRSTHAAFPGRQLAALEGRVAAVGESDYLGAVVGGEHQNG